MTKTHWRKCQNPKYLGAYELLPGQELTLTISKAGEEVVEGTDGKKEECLVVHFAEKGIKPMIFNVENSKTIEKIYGSPYIEDWIGKTITVYSKKVKAFGNLVEALRIRPFIPKEEKYFCDECKNEITASAGMTAQQIAARTVKRYKKMLCAECAIKAKEADKATNQEGDVLNNENNENQN